MRISARFVIPIVLLTLQVSPALSCPVCDRETGRLVRAGIFDRDFGYNLLASTLPFGVFLGIAGAIHFGFPRWRRTGEVPNRAGMEPEVPGG